MQTFIFWSQFSYVWIDDGLQWFLANIEKFNQSFSSPMHFFGLFVNNEGISPSHIISIEWLIRVNLIFLGSTGSHTKVNNIEIFAFWMNCFNSLKCLAIFANCLIHISRINQDFFLLSNSPKLLLPFCPFYKISRVVFLDFLIWLYLHQ